jgi:hypothetical protein
VNSSWRVRNGEFNPSNVQEFPPLKSVQSLGPNVRGGKSDGEISGADSSDRRKRNAVEVPLIPINRKRVENYEENFPSLKPISVPARLEQSHIPWGCKVVYKQEKRATSKWEDGNATSKSSSLLETCEEAKRQRHVETLEQTTEDQAHEEFHDVLASFQRTPTVTCLGTRERATSSNSAKLDASSSKDASDGHLKVKTQSRPIKSTETIDARGVSITSKGKLPPTANVSQHSHSKPLSVPIKSIPPETYSTSYPYSIGEEDYDNFLANALANLGSSCSAPTMTEDEGYFGELSNAIDTFGSSVTDEENYESNTPPAEDGLWTTSANEGFFSIWR